MNSSQAEQAQARERERKPSSLPWLVPPPIAQIELQASSSNALARSSNALADVQMELQATVFGHRASAESFDYSAQPQQQQQSVAGGSISGPLQSAAAQSAAQRRSLL